MEGQWRGRNRHDLATDGKDPVHGPDPILEVAALDAQSKKNNDAESELFLLRIAELKKTFELGNQLDISENGFLKDQIASLTQDRFKIRQNSNLLDERLARVEELIGFPADATA